MTAELDNLALKIGNLIADIKTTIIDGQTASTDLHTQIDQLTAKAADLAKQLQDAIDASAMDKGTILQLQTSVADLTSQAQSVKDAAVIMSDQIDQADAAVQAADAGLKPKVPPADPTV